MDSLPGIIPGQSARPPFVLKSTLHAGKTFCAAKLGIPRRKTFLRDKETFCAAKRAIPPRKIFLRDKTRHSTAKLLVLRQKNFFHGKINDPAQKLRACDGYSIVHKTNRASPPGYGYLQIRLRHDLPCLPTRQTFYNQQE